MYITANPVGWQVLTWNYYHKLGQPDLRYRYNFSDLSTLIMLPLHRQKMQLKQIFQYLPTSTAKYATLKNLINQK